MQAALHVHRVPVQEYARKRQEPRWCFGCRKRLPGDLIFYAPTDKRSYYGPHAAYRCDGCGHDRRDFPGTYYE